jgi:hypothetical protein
MNYRGLLQVAAFFCCATSAQTAHAVDCKTLSGKLLDSLDAGNYAAAGGDFNDQMKALSPQKLQKAWQTLTQQMGERGTRDVAQLIQADGKTIVITPVHFGSQVARAVVACSADGKITGFHIGQ